jgi:hypothetical protein
LARTQLARLPLQPQPTRHPGARFGSAGWQRWRLSQSAMLTCSDPLPSWPSAPAWTSWKCTQPQPVSPAARTTTSVARRAIGGWLASKHRGVRDEQERRPACAMTPALSAAGVHASHSDIHAPHSAPAPAPAPPSPPRPPPHCSAPAPPRPRCSSGALYTAHSHRSAAGMASTARKHRRTPGRLATARIVPLSRGAGEMSHRLIEDSCGVSIGNSIISTPLRGCFITQAIRGVCLNSHHVPTRDTPRSRAPSRVSPLTITFKIHQSRVIRVIAHSGVALHCAH